MMQWLNENDDVSLEYLNGAFQRDKKDEVRSCTIIGITQCSASMKNVLSQSIELPEHCKQVSGSILGCL